MVFQDLVVESGSFIKDLSALLTPDPSTSEQISIENHQEEIMSKAARDIGQDWLTIDNRGHEKKY